MKLVMIMTITTSHSNSLATTQLTPTKPISQNTGTITTHMPAVPLTLLLLLLLLYIHPAEWMEEKQDSIIIMITLPFLLLYSIILESHLCESFSLSKEHINLHLQSHLRPNRRRVGINSLGVHRGMQSIRRGCISSFRSRMLTLNRKRKARRRQKISLDLLLIHLNQGPMMGSLKLF